MDNKKHYLRSTRNLYYKNEGPIKVYYSYVTPVAFETAAGYLHVSKNVWSVTTGRHLTWIDGGNHDNRIEHGEFKKLLDKFRNKSEPEQKPEQKPDHLKTVGLVSAMFGILSENDKEAKVKYQKRFYEKVPGLQFPDDWDQLSVEEKEKRLDGVNKIALEKRGN